MAEPNPNPTPNPEAAPPAPQPQPAPAPQPAPTVPTENPNETFSRKYVEELRTESAGYRTKAKEYEDKNKTLEQSVGTLTTKLQTSALKAQIAVEGGKLKIVDADAALALMDKSALKFNDEKGEYEGVAEALAKLVEAKPYLIGSGQTTTPAGNPPRGANTMARAAFDQLSPLERSKFIGAGGKLTDD